MLSLLKVYEDILRSMQYDVDDTGRVSVITPTGTRADAKVDGKLLVIPTQKRLRDGFGEDVQPFHPLCESPSRKGTSPVLQHMQRSVKQHLGFLVSYMADQLVKISLNVDQHKDLPPDMADILMKLTSVTDKTQSLLDKLIPAAVKQNKLVTVYLKGPGNFKGQKVNRIAVIRFPILDELDSDSDKDMVLGIKIPAKQRKAISSILRLIVPFGDNPEEYSAGTVSRVAPFLSVFLQAYHKIATRLNMMINRLAGPLHLPIKPIALYPIEWIEEFPKLYNQIPSLNGNDGGVEEVEAVATPAAQPQQTQMPAMAGMFNNPQVAQAPVQQQVQHSRPASASTPAKQTVAELLAATTPQQQYMPPQQPQYMMPQQPMMINAYGQPVQPQIMHTGGQAQLPWQVQQQQVQMQQQNPYMQVFQQPPQQPQYMMPQQQQYMQPQQQMYPQQMYQTGPGL